MPERIVSVTSENPIPEDVLVEHIAVALRDFNYAGKVDVQVAHPFDNPTVSVFDDDVQLEEYTGPNFSGTEYVLGAEYVLSAEQIHSLGGIEAIRKLEELSRQDAAGFSSGTLPEDPYPLVTRALDALKERRESRS